METEEDKMKDRLRESIGRRFEQVRRMKGFSQARLSQLLNVSKTTLFRIEKGLHYPSAITMHQLVSQFGISLDWLMHGYGDMFREAGNATGHRDMYQKEAAEMLELMRQVPLIRHEIMAFYQQLRFDKKDVISNEIEKANNPISS
jgi:transcriptional regulator with XRE-family HTH domain